MSENAIRAFGRLIVCLILLIAWLYCLIAGNPAGEILTPYAIPTLVSWLGLEGLIKIISYRNNNKNGKDKNNGNL